MIVVISQRNSRKDATMLTAARLDRVQLRSDPQQAHVASILQPQLGHIS